MCQGEGANVNLESDKEEEADGRKVKFNIYSVSDSMVFFFSTDRLITIKIIHNLTTQN